MAFILIHLVILCIVGCNAGVVPQHFMSAHTNPAHVDIERVTTNSDENESTSKLEIPQTEISNIAVGSKNLHTSSEVSMVGVHNISEELNLPKLNVSEESHLFENNHSKEFDHSQKGDTKGLGHSRKKLKGPNRFKKNSSKGTKKVEEVAKGHFKDSLNESHHFDLERELGHPDFTKMSDHAENLMEDHIKESLSGSHHPEDLVKGSNHFDKSVSKVTDHVENITKINFNQNGINESDHADKIKKDSNHFNNVINESHQEDVLNHSHSDVARESLDFDNVHHVEKNSSGHLENVHETKINETLRGLDTIKDFQMADHFGSTSGILDETAEKSSNFKITDDRIAFKIQEDNISEDISNLHDPSDMNSFHEDNIHKKDVKSHSPASEKNPLIQHESFNSSGMILNDLETLSSGLDIRLSITEENYSLDLDVLHKDSEINSTLINHQVNETDSNDAYVMFTLSPNEDDTNSSTELSQELPRDLEININESKISFETNDTNKFVAEENATLGLFSGISLDFLLNSELAKNAASAMEVFNFTDSALTDHIIDDKNDVHDFLDLIHPPVESDQSVSGEFHGNINIREKLNGTEIDPELKSTTSEDDEKVTATMQPQILLNSTVDFDETTTVLLPKLPNSSVEETKVSQPMLNSTVEFEEATTIVSHLVFNSTVKIVDAICPPPGICIFWFLAQDTCAVNSHCLGSRICCRIGCAKTCIEV